MSMFSIGFVAALISVQPVDGHRSIAHDLIAADPFETYIALDDDQLRAARGGFRVGDDYVDIAVAGWLMTVTRTATEITARSLSDGADGPAGRTLFEMTTSSRQIAINNMLDNVHITETSNFNIAINNLAQVVNDGAVAGALARAASDSFILYAGSR